MIPQYGDTLLAGEIAKAMPSLIPRHGDQLLAEAIAEAKAHGTEVVINVKNGYGTQSTTTAIYFISH